jgi:hypothetical protein
VELGLWWVLDGWYGECYNLSGPVTNVMAADR